MQNVYPVYFVEYALRKESVMEVDIMLISGAEIGGVF